VGTAGKHVSKPSTTVKGHSVYCLNHSFPSS
jgi:hypothetical protein